MIFNNSAPSGLDYNQDIHSVDALIKDLEQPKQSYQTHETPPPAPDEDPFAPPPEIPEDDIIEDITPEMRKRAAKEMVNTINTGVSMGLGLYAKNLKEHAKYSADKAEKQMLAEALEPYVEKYGASIPPWLNLILTTGLIYSPKAIEANQDRRIKVMEIRQHQTDDKVSILNRKLKDLETKLHNQENVEHKNEMGPGATEEISSPEGE